MTPQQWRLVEDLFHEIQEVPLDERTSWLDERAPDPQVRKELELMVRAVDTAPPGGLENVIVGEMQALMGAGRDAIPLIGTKVGPYRLTKLLGQGGMGSVFEAVRSDEQFDQQHVAIKIIKPSLARDGAFLQRFKLERQILAKLDHPGIARLIDGGQTKDGVPYFVLEFVDGLHLLDFCDRHRLGLKERLIMVARICEAVHYAHSNGVIHRDIKPGNILVTMMGQPKLLDFGIAKIQTPDEVSSDTALTVAGNRPFTPHWASPEQVRGEKLTPASDVYSLGAVAYELLTGERPHHITTMSQGAIERAVCNTDTVKPSVAAKKAGKTTSWRTDISNEVDSIILTAMHKDPARRYPTAGDFAADIGRYLSGHAITAKGDSTLFRFSKRIRRNPAAWALAAVALLSIAGLVWTLLAREQTPNFDFQQVTSAPAEETHPSLLPDGSAMVYSMKAADGRSHIQLRTFRDSRSVDLSPQREEDDSQPAVSANGQQIVFRSERDGGGLFIKSLQSPGAPARKIAATGYDPAWSPDGSRIIYATEAIRTPDVRSQMNSQLWLIDVKSGQASRVESVEDGVQPAWSPDSRRLVYWSTVAGRRDLFAIEATTTIGATPVRITDDTFLDWSPVWSPDGRYIYFSSDRGGSMGLWRVRVSADGTPQRPPQPVNAPGSYVGEISFASKTGEFAFVQRSVTSTLYETAVDQPNPRFLRERANNPDISPDGKQIVYQDTPGKQEDLFLMSVDGQDARRLTNDSHRDRHPRWSPDGKKILFYSNRSGRYELWTIDVASGTLEQVTHTNGPSVLYGVWSPDGKQILYNDLGPNPPYLVANPPVMFPFLDKKSYSITAWSRDGKWMAGFGRLTGLIAYEPGNKQFRQLAPSGRDPVFFPDNKTVAYTDRSEIWTVTLDGKRKRILDAAPNEIGRQISLSADGRKLYYTVVVAAADIWVGSE
jgi:Tol biopolymer transport system component